MRRKGGPNGATTRWQEVCARAQWRSAPRSPAGRSPGISPAAAIVALVLLLVAPAAARALTIKVDSIGAKPGSDYTPNTRLGLTSTTTTTTGVTHVINRADCMEIKAATEPTVRVTWSFVADATMISATAYGIKVATADGASCSTTDMTETSTSTCKVVVTDKSFGNPLTFAGELVDVSLSQLIASIDCDAGSDSEAGVFFVIKGTNNTGTTFTDGSKLKITVDLAAPSAPALKDPAVGDKNINVSWTVTDSATTPYARVYWSTVPFSATAPSTATSRSDKLTASSYKIEGLSNGQTYYIAVTAIDANDNESASEKVLEAVPTEVQDFWEYYKASGGTDDGGYYGCSAGRPSRTGDSRFTGLLVLLAAGLLLLRRQVSGVRRNGGLGLVAMLVVGTAITPQSAWADSPRTASMDLRFGYYLPDVDSEFATTNGQTPYGSLIGASALAKSLSFDYFIFDGFGDLGVGASIGYWSATGKGRTLDGAESQDSTELLVVPITLDLVYRFNWLAFRTGFPLVPYLKGGLAYALWWSYDGNDDVSTYTGSDNKVRSARGGIAGLHGALGMRLLLDVFEPRAAKGFDLEMGINHSYLFIEYQALSINNFGSPTSLDLSDGVVMFGLAFDL
jgi:hypothetical protein